MFNLIHDLSRKIRLYDVAAALADSYYYIFKDNEEKTKKISYLINKFQKQVNDEKYMLEKGLTNPDKKE
jgi:hypothetical protein